MHGALYFFRLGALAFVTLCAALVLLNIFECIIGNDLTLKSGGKEAILAASAFGVDRLHPLAYSCAGCQ